ncbi:MAG: double-strand break repair helicase AddA [Paracoccaceae bacterium]|nr:double-strand break repair helicase AddA [Paracoccaceae bacterium]
MTGQTTSADAMQRRAAEPAASTWLSANAGSGKTSVLTTRVARLLLQGVEPQRILCLTYTKAAASEMQNRLFKLLGGWAMKPDAELAEELRKLGEARPLEPADFAKARRLFARAIETPGGLKIQTIHSFCSALLRRFPLEAGVTPRFTEMDDRAASLLHEEIVEEMATGEARGLVDALAMQVGDFAGLTAEIAGSRSAFAAPLTLAQCLALFDLPQDLTEGAVIGQVILGDEHAWWPALIAGLAAGSSTDAKAAEKLAAIDPARLAVGDLAVLETVFLTGKSAKEPFTAKIGSFPTKGTRAALTDLMDRLENLMRRVESARPLRIGLQAAQRTHVLHRFAQAFLTRYAARKAERGWLDFDDLILRAAELLGDSSVAQWVLFRLDGGIDHILVDEAQDTSPAQWRVISLLAQEFTAGRGARGDDRTLFVVGDKKQSIYSFQGADLSEFDRMAGVFATDFENAQLPFQRLELQYSFRSSQAVLRLVDLTFDAETRRAIGGAIRHLAFREAMPGRVDLWPIVPKPDKPEDGEWYDPVDRIGETHHAAVLARQIARELRRLIDEGTQIMVKGEVRPLTEGDVLILVQRRSELFHEIIRACKAERLEIAGADRLKLGGELAVRDLTALLSFLALDADDLSLAAALRSPLFGWSEAELFRLAHGRDGALLWERLRGVEEQHPQTVSILRDLRDRSDFLRPYDLIERILTRHDGRRKLIARLGPEAEDGIDSLLSQALAYERMEVPSLTGFLVWLESGEVEVKRQPDSAGRRIRVMTVHGSKGLEAPLVILPDTADRRPPTEGRLIGMNGTMAWRAGAEEAPAAMAAAKQAQADRVQDENLRLLYVAMTRAQSWLIVCGAGEATKAESWYSMIRKGIEAAKGEFEVEEVAHPSGTGLRLSHGVWPPSLGGRHEQAPAETAALPDWAQAAVTRPDQPKAPISPSDLGGAKVMPGEGSGLDAEAAMRRGDFVHRLLERLPDWSRDDWPALAERFLPDATPEEAREALSEARAVLLEPGLAQVFVADALAEVEIAADLNGARLIGVIDRLIVTKDRVLAVDFKTNAVVPNQPEDVPDGILRQMGAYAAALAQVYPDRAIETAILWTRTASLMTLPQHLVSAALAAASIP